jgi:methylated-DNA-[protein]-cysteine S-methyltransferase
MSSRDDLPRRLARAYPDTPDDLLRLRDRLAADARAEGLLDVAYRTVDSSVGSLLLAATELGLVRVAYLSEGHDVVLQTLSDRISPRILRAPARLDPAAQQLEEYFTGARHTFDVESDWRLSAGFRATVLRRLPDVAYGRTASYAAVAALVGNPKAVRAVGTACATNRSRSSSPATAALTPVPRSTTCPSVRCRPTPARRSGSPAPPSSRSRRAGSPRRSGWTTASPRCGSSA